MDGAPSALLRLMPTREMFCLPGSEMDCCQDSPSGTTSEPSMGSPGQGTSMSSAEASHVPTSRLLEQEPGLTALRAAFGGTWRGWFARYDPDLYGWRTAQLSLLEDSAPYSATWPQWGLMLDGACLALTTPTLPTRERDSGFWPTLTASIGNKCGGRHRGKADTLASRLAETERLSTSSTGRVNPTWAEWLMGFPDGWSDCRPLATRKYREWLRQHGGSCLNEALHDFHTKIRE